MMTFPCSKKKLTFVVCELIHLNKSKTFTVEFDYNFPIAFLDDSNISVTI